MARTPSDLKRAFTEDGAHKTHIGGQALIEGVMMRGKNSWALAVREPDGHIYTEEQGLSSKGSRPSWFSWPLVRGCVALVDSLVLGYKALEIAANHAYADLEGEGDFSATSKTSHAKNGACSSEDGANPAEESGVDPAGEGANPAEDTLPALPSEFADDGLHDDTSNEYGGLSASHDNAPSEHDSSCDGHDGASSEHDDSVFGKGEMLISALVGCVLGVGLFIFLPALIANVLVGEYETAPLVWNIVDGILRVVVFVFYVWLIGRMSDIKRMFMYHGAEHKTIHCYEHGLPLTPENAQNFPRLHVRCGTAFLIMVMIIAILVYTIIPLDVFLAWAGITDATLSFVALIVMRIILIPLIAGLSYEITVKWAGSHPENPLVRLVLWPGMQMQYLTTNEPDKEQLECAIAAMQMVLDREAGKDFR